MLCHADGGGSYCATDHTLQVLWTEDHEQHDSLEKSLGCVGSEITYTPWN